MANITRESLRKSLERTVREKGYRSDIVNEAMNQLDRVVERYREGKDTYVLPRNAIGFGIYSDNAQLLRRRGLLNLHYRGRFLFWETWTVTPTKECLGIYSQE